MDATTRKRNQRSNWQTSKENVPHRIAFMFNNTLLSDVHFVVTDSQDDLNNNNRRVRVPAHKFVLAISSPVFEAMFYGKMAEKGEEVELPDTDSNSLLEFLRFVYCDEVNLTSSNVLDVLYLAQKYIVPSLTAKCGSFLETQTNESNVFRILEEAKKFDEPKLEKQCWSFIDVNTSACVKSEALLTSSYDTLVSLLNRESLCVRELCLFAAVMRWAQAKCEGKGLEPTGSAMREILGNAVKLIRFPAMLLPEFEQHVVPTGILSAKEEFRVRQCLSRVCPTPTMEFPRSIRAGTFLKSNMHHCFYLYYDTTTHISEDFAERAESLTFVADKNIYLKGARLFANKVRGQKFSAGIRLLDENGMELAEEEGTFIVEGCRDFGFDILFKLPVLIWESWRHTIQVTIRGVGGTRVKRNLSAPVTTVKSAGINFTFEGERAHQIVKLYFHTLN